MDKLINQRMKNILRYVNEGIHIVNSEGKTIYYNKAMEKIEGINRKKVLNKHVLDIYPNWKKENSTLLTVLKYGNEIVKKKQSYINLKGEKINTINTTLPLYENEKVVGAIEIASNYTEVSNMSNQIIDLQKKLVDGAKDDDFNHQYYTFDDIIGRDKNFLKALKYAKKASQKSSSVLIYGETGTGKELFAQSIHSASDRKNKPFIAQNCAAIPNSLLESLLFGTKKGSFTDAKDRQGLFEQADGGTLFLDEINSMSKELQAKLLRVLQEKYIRRIGGQKDIPIDVRIIAATNTKPNELLENNTLRKDLYYRINVVGIYLPPLRERKTDIDVLVNHFIDEFNEKFSKDIWMISEEVKRLFKNHKWDGNIRELENVIESSMNFVDFDHVIRKEHLPPHFLDKCRSNKKQESILIDEIGKLPDFLDGLEKKIIKKQYKKNNENTTQTAKDLGVSRQSLQYKLNKYDL
ncbi:MAG: sigma-54 interaction domain-containing protein [Bacillota bacterium]